MNVPDEFNPHGIGFRETVTISDDEDEEDGEDDVVNPAATEGIPIVLESPILNASPLANKEPTSTLIMFDFKEGCDVHQMHGEIGFAVNGQIAREASARYDAAIHDEISRMPELQKLLPQSAHLTVFICKRPQKGVHNGQLHLSLGGVLLPPEVVLSIIGTLWESFIFNPICVPALFGGAVYEVMFSGFGSKFL